MNNSSNFRESGLEIRIQDFIQCDFPQFRLELTPEEAEYLQEKFIDDIIIDMSEKHPLFRTSMYLIKKRY